mmetsp:Transcript_3688/g.7673  ORF Transcript_3688/g.7673 Transcript_3688/m.7673 type:complete len:213 (-) Transcript_3688:204-842(-)
MANYSSSQIQISITNSCTFHFNFSDKSPFHYAISCSSANFRPSFVQNERFFVSSVPIHRPPSGTPPKFESFSPPPTRSKFPGSTSSASFSAPSALRNLYTSGTALGIATCFMLSRVTCSGSTWYSTLLIVLACATTSTFSPRLRRGATDSVHTGRARRAQSPSDSAGGIRVPARCPPSARHRRSRPSATDRVRWCGDVRWVTVRHHPACFSQ